MDKFRPKGHLEILKIYEDGTEEVHFEESNIITSGMGVGLAHLYAGSGSNKIYDFQILNFQVGTGGVTTDYGASSYKLNSPLTHGNYLSVGSEVLLEGLSPIQNGVVKGQHEYFVRIPFSNIQKVTPHTVRFTLLLDKYTANGLTTKIDEVGIFMRNPRGLNTPSPILVAYRPFTGLIKTSTFSLLFKWTLTF